MRSITRKKGDKLYRIANREKIKANALRYYQTHKKEFQFYNQEHYKLNRERKLNYAKLRYQRGQTFIHALKNNVPCKDCYKMYPPYVMQFDHRIPSEKSFEISGAKLVYPIEILCREIAKCDLVCANCHAERTFGKKGIV
jgi:hypothetical protein